MPLRNRILRATLYCAIALGALCRPEPLEAAPKKRSLPDYDGRGGERARPGDVALWVPRVALFPLYLVSEYVIRQPLGAAVSAAERAHLPEALYGLFMLNDDHTMGWVPTLFVDFGFKPSVGVYFFWNDAFTRRNDLSLHAATWGKDWLLGSVTDRIRYGEHDTITWRASALRRPDYRYYGEGPTATERQLSRYGALRFEASGSYAHAFGGQSRFELTSGVRSLTFYQPEHEYASTSTSARVSEGVFPQPAALDTGYRAGINRLFLRLDSRRERPRPQTGVRLDIDVEQGSSPQGTPRGWVRYGVIAGGFLDLNDRARVLSLSVAAQSSDPLASAAVPFTELVQLGGSELMRGFLPGRLYGRSALVSTLSYQWPVWIWLDGTIQFSVGNVYGPHFSDFTPDSLRLSSALGVRTSVSSQNPVEVLLGFGTETFGQGAHINTLRLAFGTSRGF